MISMTGYGSFEQAVDGFNYAIELRSLNSRYLEINCRMPRALMSLEPVIQKQAKKRLARGKLDVMVEIQAISSENTVGKLDMEVLANYLKISSQIAGECQSRNITVAPLDTTRIMNLQGVLTDNKSVKGEELVAQHGAAISQILGGALDKLIETRQKEGIALKDAISTQLEELGNVVAQIEEQRPKIIEELQTKVQTRLEAQIKKIVNEPQLTPASDRIATEIAILCDKADIEEEIVRLNNHMQEMQNIIESTGSKNSGAGGSGEGIGRRLDFMCQEMNRETNTMGNKLMHTSVSKQMVAAKQAIEQIRQQVQNVE